MSLQASAQNQLRQLVEQIERMRKKSTEERQEEESILEVYMHALGMLGGDPVAAPSQMLDAAE
jgi:uncharacterized protein (UPF0335 family)